MVVLPESYPSARLRKARAAESGSACGLMLPADDAFIFEITEFLNMDKEAVSGTLGLGVGMFM